MEIFKIDIAVYRKDGAQVASAGTPPELPSDLEPSSEPKRIHQGRFVTSVIPVQSETSGQVHYLVMSWDHYMGFMRFLMSILVILVVCALVMFPLARGISRPCPTRESTST